MQSIQLSLFDGKVCTKCHQWKPLSEFYKAPAGRDGHRNDCRTCAVKRTQKYKAAHPEKRIEWYAANGDEQRAKNTARYNLNKARILARQKAFYSDPANRERRRARGRHYYVTHKDQIRDYDKNRRPRDPEKRRAFDMERYWKHRASILAKRRQRGPGHERERVRIANYRAIKRGAEGTFTIAEWQAVKQACNFACGRCGRAEPDIILTIDHVIPVSKGGSNYIANIQALCLPCNVWKFTKIIDYRLSA